MGFLINLLVGAGISEKVARWLSWLVVAAALIGFVLLARWDAYRDGKRDENAAWELAIEKANRKADQSAGRATEESTVRQKDFAKRLEDEKGKIDEANRNGSSPLDALFPSE